MILQALNDYYRRKAADPDPRQRLPAFGLEEKEIPFIIEITPDGDLVRIHDTRATEGKKKVGRREQVPQGVKKTSGVAANLLWDAAEYVLGIDTRGKPRGLLSSTRLTGHASKGYPTRPDRMPGSWRSCAFSTRPITPAWKPKRYGPKFSKPTHL
jgi:hypothetical protein